MKKQNELSVLIPIKNTNGMQAVEARRLHAFLEVSTQFKDWIIRRIEEYQFVENEDYQVLLKNELNPNGGRPSKDYVISLDMAKELAMVERNEKGRLARKYFIEIEKRYYQQPEIKAIAPVDIKEKMLFEIIQVRNFKERMKLFEVYFEMNKSNTVINKPNNGAIDVMTALLLRTEAGRIRKKKPQNRTGKELKVLELAISKGI